MKTNKTLITAVVSGVLLNTSCKKLETQNADEKNLPYGYYVTGGYLTSMMQNTLRANPAWWAQVQTNLNADLYSGFMGTGTNFKGGNDNNHHVQVGGWNDYAANTPYNFVLNPWLDVKKNTKDLNKDKDQYAVATILKVLAGSRLTETFGPVPYVHIGEDVKVPFDCQSEIYNQFFLDLKEAVTILTEVEDQNPNLDVDKLKPYDVSTLGGDYAQWIKLANTLRLRLAVRIAKVNATLAKTEAEAAVGHKYGLLESTTFKVTVGGSGNWLSTISSWGDISFGAALCCYLNGYNDPRLAVYAKPSAYNGAYIGVLPGIDLTVSNAANYQKFSQVLSSSYEAEPSVQLLSKSESSFLRAEGVLNGWNMGGTAKQFYEDGITKSFSERNVTMPATYLTDNSSTEQPYIDPINPNNNFTSNSPGAAYLSTITIAWNEGASPENKLERIITQKYLAIFPDGQEAWTEFRRTGFPKLFPAPQYASNGTVSSYRPYVQRLPYPPFFSSTAASSMALGVACMGGDDQYTKLWWAK